MARACGVPVGQRSVGLGDIPKIINRKTIYPGLKKKMPQSGVGSMQGGNTGNMPSAVCASSINKSLDPTPI